MFQTPMGAKPMLPMRDDAGYDNDVRGPGTSQDYTPQARGPLNPGASAGARRPRQDFDPIRPFSYYDGPGAAFDTTRASQRLIASCGSTPGGYCLAGVENALEAGGLNIVSKMPNRNGSHWAKDLAPVLERDGRFDRVATGFGAQLNGKYEPKVGDVAVWTGGAFGHTQMFVGYDKTGHQVWMSDFKTNPMNWTGLLNPASHGEVEIFRQKPKDAPMMAQSGPVTQPASTTPRTPGGGAPSVHV